MCRRVTRVLAFESGGHRQAGRLVKIPIFLWRSARRVWAMQAHGKKEGPVPLLLHDVDRQASRDPVGMFLRRPCARFRELVDGVEGIGRFPLRVATKVPLDGFDVLRSVSDLSNAGCVVAVILKILRKKAIVLTKNAAGIGTVTEDPRGRRIAPAQE